MERGRWYFRAIESEGCICRHGTIAYDAHPELDEALGHLTQNAEASRPAQVMVHRLDGSVEPASTLD